MSGMDQLRAFACAMSGKDMGECVNSIADNIDRELEEDRQIAEWVRSQGGLESLEDEVANDRELVRIVTEKLYPQDSTACEAGNVEIADELDRRLAPFGCKWPRVINRLVDFVTQYESIGTLESISVHSDGSCFVTSHDGTVMNVKDIRPVKKDPVGSDGVPIRNNDTVFARVGDKYVQFIVTDNNADLLMEKAPVFCKRVDRDERTLFAPEELTHTNPDVVDSWDRWISDMARSPINYCTQVLGIDSANVCDEESESVRSQDLVRRGAELLKSEER